MVQIVWRTVWRFLKKLKIELPCDPGIPLLIIYPEKNMVGKAACTSVCTAALFYNSQDVAVSQVSISGWMDKDVVYIYSAILLSH